MYVNSNLSRYVTLCKPKCISKKSQKYTRDEKIAILMNFVNLANLAIGCFGLVSADRNVSERQRNFGKVEGMFTSFYLFFELSVDESGHISVIHDDCHVITDQ